MKRYRHSWILTAVTLSFFYLVLFAPAMEIPAMGQPGSNTATPAAAKPAETKETKSEEAAAENAPPLKTPLSPPEEDQEEEPETEIKAEMVIATGSDASPLEVVKVIAVISDFVIEAESGRAEEMISRMLQDNPVYGSAAVKLSDGSRKVFPIQYDYGSLDESRTGLAALQGVIAPPDGYHISAELAEVTLPVFLYNPEEPREIPVVSVQTLSRAQVVLPELAVLKDLNDLIEKGILDPAFYYTLEDGLTWSTPVSWDFDKVDFGAPGIYKATARPKLPDGILLPDGLPEMTCDIIIQEDGPLLLAPPEFNGLYMTAEWTKDTPDPDRFRCFYAIGDGEWQEDTQQALISIPRFAPQYLEVFYYENVFFETPYYFQISYDGEYSNILKVYFSEEQIHYRFCEGDRDGADREDQPAPDISQPILPPEKPTRPNEPNEPTGTADPLPEESGPEATLPTEPPPSHHSSKGGFGGSDDGKNTSGKKNNSGSYAAAGPGHIPQAAPFLPMEIPTAVKAAETDGAEANGRRTENFPSSTAAALPEPDPAAAVEEDTADYAVFSGRRFKKYRELNPGQPYIITKHRIQLEIPTEHSVFSGLEDHSLIRAELLPLSDNTVQVELSIDGVPVSLDKMPELTITMPRPAAEENASLQVTDLNGAVLTTAQAVDSSHITFTVKQTGTFRVLAVFSAVTTPDTEGLPEGPRTSGEQKAQEPPVSVGDLPNPSPDKQEHVSQGHPTPVQMVFTVLILLAALTVPSVLLNLAPFGRRRPRRFNIRLCRKGTGKEGDETP